MNATFSIWMLVSIVAIDALFIGLLVFPDRVLATWFRPLRVVPVVGTPDALRVVAAIGVTLSTFALVGFIRAWLYVWSYGQ